MANGKKPRDSLGLDLIVGCTGLAMMQAGAEGRRDDQKYIRQLSEQLYRAALKENSI